MTVKINLSKKDKHVLKISRKALKFSNRGMPMKDEFEMSDPRVYEEDVVELLVKLAKFLEI